ncbi:hypothetical protein yinte0001_10240 [Yersinia intermedia ATCC 29909]|jgi:hypothetical protein|nr:hypothetical protein yinte0001_10240 [Yersinia intermedia ATCC 29909]
MMGIRAGQLTALFSFYIDPDHLNLTKIVRWLIFLIGKVTIPGF